MTSGDEIRDCHLILTGKQQKYQLYQLEKLINMNTLHVPKYKNNLSLRIILQEKRLENKQKRLKIKEKNK